VKIETLRSVLPGVVAAIIPFFFLGVYLSSVYQRLRLLWCRCQEAATALDAEVGAGDAPRAAHPTAGRDIGAESWGAEREAQNHGRCESARTAHSPVEVEAAWQWYLAIPRRALGQPSSADFKASSGRPGAAAAFCEFNRAAADYSEFRRRLPATVLGRCCGFPEAIPFLFPSAPRDSLP
jgi:hypothetical protein